MIPSAPHRDDNTATQTGEPIDTLRLSETMGLFAESSLMLHRRSPNFVIFVRLAKKLLAILTVGAAITFLAITLRSTWSDFREVVVDSSVLGVGSLLSIMYGSTLFILAGAWYFTLRQTSCAKVTFRKAAYVYSLSNIAKYLPGSIFHFAGRQILGSRIGWRHGEIARASLLEIGATTVTGGMLFIFIVLFTSSDELMRANAPSFWQVIAVHKVEISISMLAISLLALFGTHRLGLFNLIFGWSGARLSVVLALHIAFFLCNLGIALALADHLTAAPVNLSPAIISLTYLLAWIAGFVIPGAPGGIGVREGVLVWLLAGHTDTGIAFALALGFGMRIVTTIGDLVCALIAYGINRNGTNLTRVQ